MALSSFAHRRCLAGSWNPRRGHHESNSPPGSHAYSVRQSPGHHDHLPDRGLTERSKEAVGQMLPVAAYRENPTNQSNGLHSMSHDVAFFGFPLWLRLIFHSHQVEEQRREDYGTRTEI